MNVKQCNLLFSLRVCMTLVKGNFSKRYEDLPCPVCKDTKHQDTQSHIHHCKNLLNAENILVKKSCL